MKKIDQSIILRKVFSKMDKKTEQSINNYNKIASNYDDSFDGKFTQSFKEELVISINLENSYKILDVACGNGKLLKLLSEKTDVKAYGVDISENMIKEAKRKYPDFDFRVTNSAKLPFDDKFFDVITVCAAFHHFTEPHKFITEVVRILKPGGNLYIADPYFPPLIRQIANLIFPLLKMGDVKIYSKKELVKMLQEHGFNNFEYRKFNKSGFILTVGKK